MFSMKKGSRADTWSDGQLEAAMKEVCAGRAGVRAAASMAFLAVLSMITFLARAPSVTEAPGQYLLQPLRRR